MKKLMVLAAVAVFLAGCGKKDGPGPGVNDDPVLKTGQPADTSKSNDSVRNVQVGGELVFLRFETPQQKWTVQTKPDFLTLKDENKKTYDSSHQERRFVFVSSAVGTGDLVLVLRDGLNADSPVLQTVTFKVVSTARE